ncbi:MAG TPA: hypothetical protein VFD70_15770 [Anaerolineae bacterium]|nr:hypothetical protein [Anaerolineae bacterium]
MTKPKQVRPQTAAEAMERLDRLVQTLSSAEWQRRLERLYADLVETKAKRPRRGRQEHVQEWLPFYVVAQQNNQAADRLYPEIARHLAQCGECQSAYEILQRGFLPNLVPGDSLPAVTPQPKPTDPAWERIEFPAAANQPPRFQFLIQPGVLRRSWNQLPALHRGAPESRALLISDQISFDNQSVFVQAWLAPASAQNERFDLHVVLNSSTAIPFRVQAQLDWGEHHYESILKRGRAQFNQLALVNLKSPISITFTPVSHVRSRRTETSRPAKRKRRTPAR